MKKLAICLLILTSLIGMVSAAEYSTILFDDDLDQHFSIEGWASSQSYEEIDVVIRYNLTLTHPHFNSTEINKFEAILADNGEKLASDKIEDMKLKSGNSSGGFLDIKSENPPNRVNEIIFKINHTGVTASGSQRISYAENDVDYSVTSEYPEILSFKPNQSEAERGQNITITVHTDDIQSLEAEGRNLTRVENNTFQGEFKIPGTSDGEMNYTLRADNGNKFTETVNISVENPAPELNVSYKAEVSGEQIEIDLRAEDDIKVRQTYLIFQKQRYNTTEETKVHLPIQDLQTGQYNFTAVAIDNEGAETRQNYSFEVKEPSNSETEEGQQKVDQEDEDEETSKDEEPDEPAKSFPGVFIDPLIEFIESKI